MRTYPGRSRGRATALILAIAAASLPVFAYPPPPPDPTVPASTVSPAVQQLRRSMLDAEVNTLTFRSMDRLFTTRTVARSGPVWHLPREDHAPDFSYTFRGQARPATEFLGRTFTDALLILKDGRIVTELYRNNADEQTRFMAFSMTKSITSTLVGIALEEKRIQSLDDPVTRYLPELRGGGYDGVTVRHILQMRSGVDYEERYDFGNPGTAARNHELSLVKNVVRFADAARTIPRKHRPGTVFEYKTLDTAVLGWLIERVSGGSTVAAYTAQRVWEPLGAEADAYYIMDGEPGTGREFSGAGLNATLRDFARFGQMVLQEGEANGRRIVSAEWLREATRPTPTSPGEAPNARGGYGYQWWMTETPGAFQAIGLQGQFLYIDRDTRTVIVKLSHFPPTDTTAAEETAAFFRAASAWNPKSK
jgi:CubicO group peptidase (beta-lactamase class C family)